jgi:hypothetical protein
MTAENRWLFDFDDMLQIHFVCSQCKAALSIPPRKVRRVPPQCVNCGEKLYSGDEQSEALKKLADALDAMAGMKSDKLKVRLEFRSPHAQSVSGA